MLAAILAVILYNIAQVPMAKITMPPHPLWKMFHSSILTSKVDFFDPEPALRVGRGGSLPRAPGLKGF